MIYHAVRRNANGYTYRLFDHRVRGYIGVYKTYDGKYAAMVGLSYGRYEYCGTYETEIDAALAFDDKQERMNGDNGKLNFPRRKQHA